MRDLERDHWNRRQQALRQALSGKGEGRALDLFLAQHAMVHAAAVSGAGLPSFEDQVWAGLPGEASAGSRLGWSTPSPGASGT